MKKVMSYEELILKNRNEIRYNINLKKDGKHMLTTEERPCLDSVEAVLNWWFLICNETDCWSTANEWNEQKKKK